MQRQPMASSSSSCSPCAACKFLRRKCLPGCIFAPYFPPEEPQKFANVHKIFGASNVSKLLHEVLPHQREDAVSTLAYEAEARIKDPVYGCVGTISVLQLQVQRLQKDLEAAHAELLRYTCGEIVPAALPAVPPIVTQLVPPGAQQYRVQMVGRRVGGAAVHYNCQVSGAAMLQVGSSPLMGGVAAAGHDSGSGHVDRAGGGERFG